MNVFHFVALSGMQLCHGAMHHILDQATRQGLQHFINVFAFGEHSSGFRKLSFAPAVCGGVELLNERHAGSLVHPAVKVLNASFNDVFGMTDSGLPTCLAYLNNAGEVIQVLEVDIAQGLDIGLDVTRNRQIQHENGLLFSALDGTFHGAQSNDG